MRTVGVLLVFAISGFCDSSWVTSLTPGALRTDGPYALGLKFGTNSRVITITQLGRYCFPGNSATHVVYLLDGSGTTVLASAAVHMSGCVPGTFSYAPAQLTLAANTSYFVLSAETAGGDAWGDNTSSFTTTAVATDLADAYSTSIPPTSTNTVSSGQIYGGVGFQYLMGYGRTGVVSGFPVVY